MGKVWRLNRHKFHSPHDVDDALQALGFNYHEVHSTVIGWNDAEGLNFDEIADRLDAWALRVDENGGRYVPPQGVHSVGSNGFMVVNMSGDAIYVTFNTKGKLTVKVTENEGALV